MDDKLDKIIAFIEAEQYEENQSQYGYGWQEMSNVVNAEDLITFIEKLKTKE
ncbi:hypothetical protein HB762_27195 (plasmid) [Vibrio campbellii]|uniref:Uncharacterized protein n=1 Tax=Vibrio campbellii TaxID=680 RepID=A0ABY5IMV1_9VIBR|nr:hypothetical protein [Vibrio campbellii]UTZ34952.1 hypothetical protein HB762_27195 [Vibrio campbellii]